MWDQLRQHLQQEAAQRRHPPPQRALRLVVIVLSPELNRLAERQAESRLHPSSLIARLQPWLTLEDFASGRAGALLKDSFSTRLATELRDAGTAIVHANVAIVLGLDQDPAPLESVLGRFRELLERHSTEVAPFHWLGIFHGPAADGSASAGLYAKALDSLFFLGSRNPGGAGLEPAERDWLTLRLLRWLQTVEASAETTQSFVEWIQRGGAQAGFCSSAAAAEVSLGIEYLTETAALYVAGRRLHASLLGQPDPTRIEGYEAGFLAQASMGSAGTLDDALLAESRPHLVDPIASLPSRSASGDEGFAALLIEAGESLETTAAANGEVLRERFLPLWVAEWTILLDRFLGDAVNHQTGGLRLALDLTTRLESHLKQLTESPAPTTRAASPAQAATHTQRILAATPLAPALVARVLAVSGAAWLAAAVLPLPGDWRMVLAAGIPLFTALLAKAIHHIRNEQLMRGFSTWRQRLEEDWRCLMHTLIARVRLDALGDLLRLVQMRKASLERAAARVQELVDYACEAHTPPTPQAHGLLQPLIRDRASASPFFDRLPTTEPRPFAFQLETGSAPLEWSRFAAAGAETPSAWEHWLLERLALRAAPGLGPLFDLSLLEVLRQFPNQFDRAARTLEAASRPFCILEPGAAPGQATAWLSAHSVRAPEITEQLHQRLEPRTGPLQRGHQPSPYELSLVLSVEGLHVNDVRKGEVD